MLKVLLRVLLGLAILGAGFGVLAALVALRKQPERKPLEELAVLVETTRVEAVTRPMRVSARGSVVPAREVVLIPEVSGRVHWQHAELVPGGRVRAGETLVRIDASAYALEAARQAAQVEQAKRALELERARKAVAENEWRIIGDEAATAAGKAVALREPQLESAKAGLLAAEKGQALTRLNLGRTTLIAPFNAFVRDEQVDVGQLVGPQSRLATLVGTDEFWIQTSVPVDVLNALRIPGVNAAVGDPGSSARVVQEVAGQTLEHEGRVIRLLGELEPVGRMARLLVEVKDPMHLGRDPAGAAPGASAARGEAAAPAAAPPLPLLLGSYVRVELEGAPLERVVQLPRTALQPEDRVYVFGKDGRLEVREVTVVWRERDHVLVSHGVSAGDEVVVSRVAAPVPGMLLKRPSEQPPAAAAPSAKPVLGAR